MSPIGKARIFHQWRQQSVVALSCVVMVIFSVLAMLGHFLAA